MNPRERVLAALRCEDVDRKPVSSVTQVGIVEAMEKVNVFWPEAHYDPEKMAILGASLYNLVGLEALRVPFCLTVEAEALGCGIKVGKIDIQPSVSAHLGSVPEEVPEDFLNRGRVPVVLRAIKLLSERHLDAPIIVGVTGPMTLAGHILGVENLLRLMVRQPNTLQKALDFCTRLTMIYVNAIIDHGADVICVADPTASPDITPPTIFNQALKPYLQKIANEINKRCLSVLHICGRAQKILSAMAETCFNALSVEEKVDVAEARKIVKPNVAIVGNISASKTLLTGTPEEVKEEVRKILDHVNVVAPGCGLAPRTPLRNVQAMVEAVKQGGR